MQYSYTPPYPRHFGGRRFGVFATHDESEPAQTSLRFNQQEGVKGLWVLRCYLSGWSYPLVQLMDTPHMVMKSLAANLRNTKTVFPGSSLLETDPYHLEILTTNWLSGHPPTRKQPRAAVFRLSDDWCPVTYHPVILATHRLHQFIL
jgi:hypothetical protein